MLKAAPYQTDLSAFPLDPAGIITAISGTTITLNSAADATVASAAMAFFAPTFKEWGAIDL